MDRRAFVSIGTCAFLGSIFGASPSTAAARASLSVRATPNGPLVTPNDKFFGYSQFRYPEKLPTGVQIDGLVNAPAQYSLDELSKMQTIKKLLTMECFVNTAGGALLFTTPFEGVPLSALFEKAGVKPEAKSAQIVSADGKKTLVPLSGLRRTETMLVSKHGSEVVPMRHGSPYTRLLIPGFGANQCPKWVTRITLVENTVRENHSPPMAGFLFPKPPMVTAKMPGITLTGYAYSGPEKVGSVEVSTDNGKTYRAMPLPPQPDPDLWITWELNFRPPEPGFYVLRIKATSAEGRKQDYPGTIAVQVS
jgi:DMSO/TMAO reductase YedYZ molybdopterin-dependent catalytic subunit